MSISKEQAIELVEERINVTDLDWPNRPPQVVYDGLTQTRADGWLFYYAIDEEHRVRGRDPEPEQNPPWFVDGESGELSLQPPADLSSQEGEAGR